MIEVEELRISFFWGRGNGRRKRKWFKELEGSWKRNLGGIKVRVRELCMTEEGFAGQPGERNRRLVS